MADEITIEFGFASKPGANGERADVFITGSDVQVENLDAGASSVATTMTANRAGMVAVVTNADSTDIWVTFAPSPTAVKGTTHRVLASTQRVIGGIQEGWKAAAIRHS